MSKKTDTAVAFDFDALTYADTFRHFVKHPVTGETTSWWIDLAGPGHAQTLAAEERELRAAQDEMERTQQEQIEAVKAGKPIPKARKTRAEVREANAQFLAARIVASSPAVINGERIELTAENAAAVLSNPNAGWLVEQINEALGTKGNFIKSSAAT